MSAKRQITSGLTGFTSTVSGTLIGINAATLVDQPLFAVAGTIAGMLTGHFLKAQENRKLAGYATGAFLGLAASVLPHAVLITFPDDHGKENVVHPLGIEYDEENGLHWKSIAPLFETF